MEDKQIFQVLERSGHLASQTHRRALTHTLLNKALSCSIETDTPLLNVFMNSDSHPPVLSDDAKYDNFKQQYDQYARDEMINYTSKFPKDDVDDEKQNKRRDNEPEKWKLYYESYDNKKLTRNDNNSFDKEIYSQKFRRNMISSVDHEYIRRKSDQPYIRQDIWQQSRRESNEQSYNKRNDLYMSMRGSSNQSCIRTDDSQQYGKESRCQPCTRVGDSLQSRTKKGDKLFAISEDEEPYVYKRTDCLEYKKVDEDDIKEDYFKKHRASNKFHQEKGADVCQKRTAEAYQQRADDYSVYTRTNDCHKQKASDDKCLRADALKWAYDSSQYIGAAKSQQYFGSACAEQSELLKEQMKDDKRSEMQTKDDQQLSSSNDSNLQKRNSDSQPFSTSDGNQLVKGINKEQQSKKNSEEQQNRRNSEEQQSWRNSEEQQSRRNTENLLNTKISEEFVSQKSSMRNNAEWGSRRSSEEQDSKRVSEDRTGVRNIEDQGSKRSSNLRFKRFCDDRQDRGKNGNDDDSDEICDIDATMRRMTELMNNISHLCECYYDSCPKDTLSVSERKHLRNFHRGVLPARPHVRTKKASKVQDNEEPTSSTSLSTNVGVSVAKSQSLVRFSDVDASQKIYIDQADVNSHYPITSESSKASANLITSSSSGLKNLNSSSSSEDFLDKKKSRGNVDRMNFSKLQSNGVETFTFSMPSYDSEQVHSATTNSLIKPTEFKRCQNPAVSAKPNIPSKQKEKSTTIGACLPKGSFVQGVSAFPTVITNGSKSFKGKGKSCDSNYKQGIYIATKPGTYVIRKPQKESSIHLLHVKPGSYVKLTM